MTGNYETFKGLVPVDVRLAATAAQYALAVAAGRIPPPETSGPPSSRLIANLGHFIAYCVMVDVVTEAEADAFDERASSALVAAFELSQLRTGLKTE